MTIRINSAGGSVTVILLLLWTQELLPLGGARKCECIVDPDGGASCEWDEIISSCTDTTELEQRDLDLGTVGADTFVGYRNLERLILHRNRIATVEAGALRPLNETLEILDLSLNRITAVPEGVYSHLGRLFSFDLQGNRIAFIHADAFLGMDGLSALYLSNNLIGRLDYTAFREMPRLAALHVENNEVDRFDVDALIALPRLVLVKFRNNSVTAILSADGTARRNDRLQRIDLSLNRVRTLDCSWFHRTGSLAKLDLTGNAVCETRNCSGGQFGLVSLTDNPFHCDCRALPAARWFADNEGAAESPVCSTPEDKSGRVLRNITAGNCDVPPTEGSTTPTTGTRPPASETRGHVTVATRPHDPERERSTLGGANVGKIRADDDGVGGDDDGISYFLVLKVIGLLVIGVLLVVLFAIGISIVRSKGTDAIDDNNNRDGTMAPRDERGRRGTAGPVHHTYADIGEANETVTTSESGEDTPAGSAAVRPVPMRCQAGPSFGSSAVQPVPMRGQAGPSFGSSAVRPVPMRGRAVPPSSPCDEHPFYARRTIVSNCDEDVHSNDVWSGGSSRDRTEPVRVTSEQCQSFGDGGAWLGDGGATAPSSTSTADSSSRKNRDTYLSIRDAESQSLRERDRFLSPSDVSSRQHVESSRTGGGESHRRGTPPSGLRAPQPPPYHPPPPPIPPKRSRESSHYIPLNKIQNASDWLVSHNTHGRRENGIYPDANI